MVPFDYTVKRHLSNLAFSTLAPCNLALNTLALSNLALSKLALTI